MTPAKIKSSRFFMPDPFVYRIGLAKQVFTLININKLHLNDHSILSRRRNRDLIANFAARAIVKTDRGIREHGGGLEHHRACAQEMSLCFRTPRRPRPVLK